MPITNTPTDRSSSTPLSFDLHDEPLSAVAFQSRGPLLASACTGGLLALWFPGGSTKALAQTKIDIEDKFRNAHTLIQFTNAEPITKGEAIELLAFAPLGDPIEIRLGNSRLSLRRAEAAGIGVRLA